MDINTLIKANKKWEYDQKKRKQEIGGAEMNYYGEKLKKQEQIMKIVNNNRKIALEKSKTNAPTYTPQQQAQRAKRFSQNNPSSKDFVSGAAHYTPKQYFEVIKQDIIQHHTAKEINSFIISSSIGLSSVILALLVFIGYKKNKEVFKKMFNIKRLAVIIVVICLGICGYKYYDYKAYENSIDKAEELAELVSDVKDCKIEVKDNTATVYAKLYVKPKRLQKEIKEDIIKRVKSCKIKNVNKIKVEF